MTAFMRASAVPPGLGAFLPLEPGNKLPGYYRMSLRDNLHCITTGSVWFHQLHTQVLQLSLEYVLLEMMNDLPCHHFPLFMRKNYPRHPFAVSNLGDDAC